MYRPKIFFLHFILLGYSLQASELDSLESRIDKMLMRLNNIQDRTNSDSVPEPPPKKESVAKDGIPSKEPPISQNHPGTQSSQASRSLQQLESRIDNLLDRLNIEAKRLNGTDTVNKRNDSPPELPSVDLAPSNSDSGKSYALPDDLSNQDFDPPPLPRNRLNFHLGLCIPNDSTFSGITGNYAMDFDNGFELGLEYNRYFEDESFIGVFIEGKFFDTASISGYSSSGENTALNGGIILGQDWKLSEHFALKTQASIGTTLGNYEIYKTSVGPMSSGSSIYIIDYNGDDLSFHYSLHLGLEFRWNEFWKSSLYYEFDGHTSNDRIGSHSFHQVGVTTGFGF